MVHIGNDWDDVLKDSFSSEWYSELREFLKEEYARYTVYPDMHDIFNALKATPFSSVKAVILGQDPYHNPGEAHGMCFSVKPGVRIPPSLKNIFKELNADLGIPISDSGYLKPWADEGVLLLNTILTVRKNEPFSHKGKGWERLTDNIIGKLNERGAPVVFLLWGAPARAKKALITSPRHRILEAAHPSPLSASNGFFGCRHFSKTNAILFSQGIAPIDWDLNKANRS